MVAAAVTSEFAVDIDVDDSETMSGRQRLVEAEEAGCMMAEWLLVGAEHRPVYLRPVEDMRRLSQRKWKERLRSVGRD